MIRDLLSRARALLRRGPAERELDEELRFHFDRQVEQNLRAGMTPGEAARRAGLEFGGMDQVKEECRDARGVRFAEALAQDLRYCLRMLRRAPGFTAIAVLTLALGIGANSSLFSVVNGVLLNPLPYPHPEELMTIHESKANFRYGSISYPNFIDWRRENKAFSAMAVSRGASFSLTGLGDAEQIGVQFVTSDFFAVLGVHPAMGRSFTPDDDRVGSAPIALVSEGFWSRKLGSAPDVVGRTLTLNGNAYTIVGVVPSDFNLSVGSFRPSQIYLPLVHWSNSLLFNRGAGLGLHGIGRLRPGVTMEQASLDLARVTSALSAEYPGFDKGIGATLIPFKAQMVGRVEPFLLLLFGAVGFVLLIVCVNIANLVLVRSTGRSREFAVRIALGAGKGRIVRQLLTESLVLAAAGGALGLLLAYYGTRAALAALPAQLPRAQEVGMDLRVLGFTAAASLLAGILFGLFPALRISRTSPLRSLKEGARGSSGPLRAQGAFVVGEIAMALVLLVGAALMMRSLVQLWSVDPGFNPRNLLTFGYSMSPERFQESADATRAAIREIDERIAAAPGVQSESMSWGALPLGGDDEWQFWKEGHPRPANENDMSSAIDYVVGPDYLRVMGTPLVRGRFFTRADNERSPHVVVVDEAFARQFFPGQDPIGRHIFLNILESDPGAEIVGVVGHVKQWGIAADDSQNMQAELYFPLLQLPDPMVPTGLQVIVRATASASEIFDPIRRSLRAMDSGQTVFGEQTMDEVISASIESQRFSAVLLGAFAAVALLLSCLGIYGVISYLVTQRSQEIGIRMALGAQRGDVLRLVVARGASLALAGIAVGVGAALALTRLMAGMLYGVSATDPLTFGAVALLLALVALAACLLPALRATRVDPMMALRHE